MQMLISTITLLLTVKAKPSLQHAMKEYTVVGRQESHT
jgi:hypothetical protein